MQTVWIAGQQRTVALSVKLAERQLIEEMVGEPPVLLLDDVLRTWTTFAAATCLRKRHAPDLRLS